MSVNFRKTFYKFPLARGVVQYSQSTAANDQQTEWENAKPYSKIPGPKPLPIPKIGNVWRFLPFGTYGNMQFLDLQAQLFKQYGPVVKLSGTGKDDMVLVNDPEDVELIYRNEGQWPLRRNAESFDYYRRYIRRDIFGDFLGVATTQGEEWQKNRAIINKPMMKPQNIKNYHDSIQVIASDFVQRMRGIKNNKNEMPDDFMNELNKWALESVAMVSLDRRLGCLDSTLHPESEAQILINSALKVFDYIYKLDVLPSLWMYISTRNWREFVKHCDVVTNTCMKHIENKLQEINFNHKSTNSPTSILEMFLKEKGGQQTAITMVIDLITSGIDTTSNSVAFIMYHLATNQKEQDVLHSELKEIMPKKSDNLPKDYENFIPYLKACVKETQRLSPIIPGNSRGAGADLVLKGFQIPKGVLSNGILIRRWRKSTKEVLWINTNILMANMAMGRNERFFENPLKWMPSRWLRGKEGNEAIGKRANPFITVPFGFGSRMCVGRRLAELEIHSILSKIFRNFKLSYDYGELKVDSKFLIHPAIPLKFRLVERPD